MIKFGMCFSKDFIGTTPLSHIGRKLPVYVRLLELCQKQGWEVYAVTRKTYKGDGNFEGVWLFKNGKFRTVKKVVKIDLIFDWVGSLLFPPKDGRRSNVVNVREFKELCWNKWKAYLKLSDYMPKSFWVGELSGLGKAVNKVKTNNVVLKPFDGLRGKDIFIGSKKCLRDSKFRRPGRKYILQEFVDTSGGIPNLTPGKHDLRVVVVNGEVVWCHIRVPAKGSLLANAAQGGSLTEVDYSKVPESVKKIVKVISKKFYKEYDNPIFSLDFGIDKKGIPKIFEINDQIGFPRWEMKGRDVFLNSLVENFKSKLN